MGIPDWTTGILKIHVNDRGMIDSLMAIKNLNIRKL